MYLLARRQAQPISFRHLRVQRSICRVSRVPRRICRRLRAARLYCALEPNGDIEPCVFIPLKVGNILRDDFLEVWQNHPTFKKIRDRENFKGVCGSCEYRNVCGGCRARAYAYFGDLAESDPGCILNQEAQQSIQQQRVQPVRVIPMQLPA